MHRLALALALLAAPLAGCVGSVVDPAVCRSGPGPSFLEGAVHRSFHPHPDGYVLDRNGTLAFVHLQGETGTGEERAEPGLHVPAEALHNVTGDRVREIVDRLRLAEDRDERRYNVTEAYAAELPTSTVDDLCQFVVANRDEIAGEHPHDSCMDGATRSVRISTTQGVWSGSAYCGGEGEDAFDELRERLEAMLETARGRAGVPPT
jgi:hypothetical protein